MLVFLVAIAVVVLALVVVAAISDHRDRRSGFDPRVRTQSVRDHRREVKEQLFKSRARRMGWSGSDDDDPRRRR